MSVPIFEPVRVFKTSTYTYDGEGRRVKKSVNGVDTVFVYDPFGNLAQEYAPAPTDTGTKYITADHLGSTRLVTTSAGAADKCYDYLPFGEEIGAGTAARPTGGCFGGSQYPSAADKISDKFTSKERDAETGLDFFGARYFSSAQGRFTTPDWSEKPEPIPYADVNNPQSLNLYNYMRNNPLSGIDPDGHCCWDALQQWAKDNPRTAQTVQGAGKIAVGVGLVATIAVGDVPGSAAGAVMVASATISATTTGVSGVADVMGVATNTNVKEGQKALEAVSNIPAMVTTAATGGNLEAGARAGTIADAAQLAAKPQEALKNAATMAEAGKTVIGVVDLVKSVAGSTASGIRGLLAGGAEVGAHPPVPKPPPSPACSTTGDCR
ncbi:MAG: RHS repeat-associated core domain-containing protein [Bryobacteraceae bacterium]